MPNPAPLSESVFRDAITRAVQDVFKTMLGQTPTLMETAETPASEASSWDRPAQMSSQQVVGTVGFIGDISGLIYLYLEDSFANEAAGHMLGMTPEEIREIGTDVVNDAVGELTNMTVGTFKNELADKGFPCRLTIPSILRGSNFTVQPISSATRRTYQFKVEKHHLVADLLMKLTD